MKMNTKMNYSRLLTYVAVIICFSSCERFVDIESPRNQLTTDKVFSDSTNANSALLGIYINMMQAFDLGFSSGGMTAYPGLSSDEIYPGTTDLVATEFYENALTPANSINTSLWISAYSLIYGSNACIEGMEASPGLSARAKNQMISEAKVIRAFLYFNLVNLYGPVPLALTTDYNRNRLLPRDPVDSVYAQIIADLQFAQAYLPQSSTVVTERAGFYAATALLAKVYLYTSKYELAKEEADKVINSGKFSLMADLNTVFLTTSRETIWRFLPVYPGKETWEGYYFVPSSLTVVPKFVLSESLLASFEGSDKRKDSWVGVSTSGGIRYPFPYKYKKGAATTTAQESYAVFRLAELYLIRAEAHAQLNEGESALSDLNMVRKRSGLPDLRISDGSELLQSVANERRHELFCEWGNRWFDLKRTGRADVVLTAAKNNWKAHASLFPVPLSELNSNPGLEQNAGY